MTRWERAALFACVVSLCFAALPVRHAAHAGDMDKAIAAVKNSSDQQLREEVERRRAASKSGGAERSAAPATRGITAGPVSALALLDNTDLLTAVHATSRSIYGPDDRKDWYQIVPAGNLEPLARASVALFDAARVRNARAGGTIHIRAKSFQEAHRLSA